MVLCLINRHRFALRVWHGDDRAQLKFIVEAPGRTETRHRIVGSLELARSPNSLAARSDRRGAAVVADRHPLVIWQQRIVRAELPPDIGRMVETGVEVGVVADVARQAEFNVLPRYQCRSQCIGLPTATGETIDTALRNAFRTAVPAPMRRFMSLVSINPACRRSSTSSPIAMPIRQSTAPGRRKRPSGRF